MEKISKKQLRASTENTLANLLTQHEISSPSKRTKRVIAKVSKRFSDQLKEEIKKRLKKNVKAYKKVNGQEKAVAA
jgi:uncharacterized protein YdaU (DUF1376 family)